jgi:hypothetical protein
MQIKFAHIEKKQYLCSRKPIKMPSFRSHIVLILMLLTAHGAHAQFSRLASAIQRERQMNEGATLLWGQRGCEASGYVVALGTDGYYSVWNDNAKQWQISTPAASILIRILLYDPRAVCIQRWTGGKWCIIDTQAHPNRKGMYQNAEVVSYAYDDIKCVSYRAPIAVAKGNGEKRKWGLVTCNPATGVWKHTVYDEWESMRLKLSGRDDVFYARAHKSGYSALFAVDGSVIAEGAYEDLLIEDGLIKYKQNGQWTVLKPFVVQPNYKR